VKTFATILLGVAGIVSLAFGTAARAQPGYQCTYNCVTQCQYYGTCITGSFTCTDGTPGQRNSIVGDTKLFGGCVTGGTANCSVILYQCNNRGYTDLICKNGCCLIGRWITFCAC